MEVTVQLVPALGVDRGRLRYTIRLALENLAGDQEHLVVNFVHDWLLAVHQAEEPNHRRCHLQAHPSKNLADFKPEGIVEDDVLDVVATAIGLVVDVRRIVVVAAAAAALLPAPLVLLLDEVFVLVTDDDLAEVAL
eukprot:3305099-Pleurochrysis_carterae.AAC.1